MNKTMQERIARLRERSGFDDEAYRRVFSLEESSIILDKPLDYLNIATQPAPRVTACNRAIDLKKVINCDLHGENELKEIQQFCAHNRNCPTSNYLRCQGSVPANTHIKKDSDIDLLVFMKTLPHANISEWILSVGGSSEGFLEAFVAYKRGLKRVLENNGYTVESKAKSLRISHKNDNKLAIEADVVPAIREKPDFNEYSFDKTTKTRIVDTDNEQKITNQPFLTIERIEQKDKGTDGALRRLIRLLKNLKADFNEDSTETKITLSSFDLSSIVYRMLPDGHKWNLLENVRKLREYLYHLYANPSSRYNLQTIDDRRLIFDKTKETEQSNSLEYLIVMLDELLIG